jgi:hypothetical protein
VAWPFSTAELTAGLRRYLAEPALHIRELAEQPLPPAFGPSQAPSAVRGLRVRYAVRDDHFVLACVVKEPAGAARPGLANPGVREAGIYRSLSLELPMPTPALIASDPTGSWLVLEAVEAVPALCGADDYLQAIALLAQLHERFWGLADDLAVYPWLARPLTLDYEIHVYAAATALGQIVRDEWPPLIARSPQTLGTLGQIIFQAEKVVQPLRTMPFTLLHGDFWAGNVVRDAEGDMIVLDWQLAGIGPGVLDLVVMITTDQWVPPQAVPTSALPPPQSKLIARYRREIAHLLGLRWSDAQWSELWDHALLWRFMQEMLPWVASASPAEFLARERLFDDVWLDPVLAAAGRRLAPFNLIELTNG